MGAKLPPTNPGTAGGLLTGKQLIDQNGTTLAGTMEDFSNINLGSLQYASGYDSGADPKKIMEFLVKMESLIDCILRLPFGADI